MRALRINDFSMSPPKARKVRESLHNADSVASDIKNGSARKPSDFVMNSGPPTGSGSTDSN
jgi:hypothetical protein